MNDILQRPDEVWLLNLGYVSDHSEQNLMLYGYLSSPGVEQVELLVDVNTWMINYAIVLNHRSWMRYKLQRWLESKGGLFGKLALLCFLKVLGSYDPSARVARCVKDYAGTTWKTKTEVVGVNEYLKIVGKSRGQGWFYKDGTDEDSGVRREDRPGGSASASS